MLLGVVPLLAQSIGGITITAGVTSFTMVQVIITLHSILDTDLNLI